MPLGSKMQWRNTATSSKSEILGRVEVPRKKGASILLPAHSPGETQSPRGSR